MKKLNPAAALSLGLAALALSAPRAALALEPLPTFLLSARKNAVGNRLALAQTQFAGAKKDESFWKLFPSLTASAGYTFNSNSATISVPGFDDLGDPTSRSVTINRRHQLDASATLSVALLDLPAIHRYRGAKAGHTQAQIEQEVAAQRTDLLVSRAYFTYMAGIYSDRVSASYLAAAQSMVEQARKRLATGDSQTLEVRKAELEVTRIKETQHANRVSMEAAARALKALTGLTPSAVPLEEPERIPVDPPLAAWDSLATSLPSVRSAQAGVDAASAGVAAAKTAYLPRIVVTATDRLTNNVALGNQPNIITGNISAIVTLDPSMPAIVRSQEATRVAARLKAEETLDAAREMIAAAYDQVQLQRARYETLRETAAVARAEADRAYDRHNTLQVSASEALASRLAVLDAEIEKSRAYAEFCYARAVLNIVSGRDMVSRR